MSYEQHYNLCKKGFDILLKQFYCIEEQKENLIKIEKNILVNKRNNNTVNNDISNNHELNYIIEDFIYNKKIFL